MTRSDILDWLHTEYGAQPMTAEESRRFAELDANEYETSSRNYHAEILQSMFWGGATTEQLEAYRKEYLSNTEEE